VSFEISVLSAMFGSELYLFSVIPNWNKELPIEIKLSGYATIFIHISVDLAYYCMLKISETEK